MQQIVNSTIDKSFKLIKELKLDEAESLLTSELQKNPQNTAALNLLGQLFLQKEDYETANSYFIRSTAINPEDYLMQYYLGLSYQKISKYNEALIHFFKSYKLNNNFPKVYNHIGFMLALDHNYYDAYLFYKMAIQHDPENIDIVNNLFHVSKKLGLHKEALQHCRKRFELDPSNRKALMGIIFNSYQDPDLTLADFQEYAIDYYRRFLKREHIESNFKEQLDVNKKQLKIGIVSYDLFLHPVSTIFYEILKRINKNDFEIYLYYTNNKYDEVTEKFKALTSNFEDFHETDDLDAAKKIQKDGIDILFDLSGYTKGHRLGIFAYKPAPVQISYLGFFGTLGMPEIDYLIADDILVQETEKNFYTEKIYSLGASGMHSALREAMQADNVAAFTRNGYVTFGCMNKYRKVSDEAINAWSTILKQCPGSKLLFNCSTFARESNIAHCYRVFAKHGIAPDRLVFKSDIPRLEFLRSYSEIDICLDPFPYGGGTTTMESLLNHTPVITIFGDRWIGRVSSMLLKAIGCGELVAHSLEEYIKIAIELANNRDRIKDYKSNLKSMIENSDLNIEKFIKRFEHGLKDIWQKESSKR